MIGPLLLLGAPQASASELGVLGKNSVRPKGFFLVSLKKRPATLVQPITKATKALLNTIVEFLPTFVYSFCHKLLWSFGHNQMTL